MVNVIAWPPVGTVGRDFTHVRPVSRSASLLTGARYVSAAQRRRRVATVKVAGIGPDGAGAGYVEMFKEYLDGGINLARVSLCSPVWYGALRGLAGLRGARKLQWAKDDTKVDWVNGAAPLEWSVGQAVAGVAGSLAGMSYLDCTGLPANQRVAFPSETVRVIDAARAEHLAKVVRVASSDQSGVARVFLDASLPSGDVLIGYRESVVYEVEDLNNVRALQPVSGNFSFTFNLREVFEDETDGFTEVNPWGIDHA